MSNTNNNDQQALEKSNLTAGQSRKPYQSPKLTSFGNIGELTSGSTGAQKDVKSVGSL